MENNKAIVTKQIMESPYKLSKLITSNDTYIEGLEITMKDGYTVVFDIYQRLNDKSNDHHFIVIKNDTDIWIASTLNAAHEYIEDYLTDSNVD